MKLTSVDKFRIFYSIGLVGFVVAIVATIWFDMWWWFLASLVYCKIIVLVGSHVGYHRYFTHSSFITSSFKHKLLCWAGFLTGEGSPISYVIFHHHHHKYSDQLIDIQSPKLGMLTACTWNLQGLGFFENKQINNFPRKLYKDSTVKFIHNNFYQLWTVVGIISLLISWKFFLFFVLMPIGHNNLVSTIVSVLMHCQLPGSYKKYSTHDLSVNNTLIQLLVLGEGLHNNHHYRPTEYNQALHKGEFDPAGWIIKKFFIVKERK